METGVKKPQLKDGVNKPLFGGLLVKTRLAYSVFMNYEKQTDFYQAGIAYSVFMNYEKQTEFYQESWSRSRSWSWSRS